MPTYIALMNWTDQGIRDFRDTVSRARSVSDAAARLGGTIRDTFWTVGPYDAVGIADFPDDESATAFLLSLGSMGNVRTTTLRAFNADEMSAIIGKAGWAAQAPKDLAEVLWAVARVGGPVSRPVMGTTAGPIAAGTVIVSVGSPPCGKSETDSFSPGSGVNVTVRRDVKSKTYGDSCMAFTMNS